jgi:hypothetical protein
VVTDTCKVGNPDPHVFGPPGSDPLVRGMDPGSGPSFSLKGVERTGRLLAKLNFNTKFQQKINFLRLKKMCLWVSYKKKI